MRRQHIDIQVHTEADAVTVYRLLRDGAGWPSWSPIDSFALERTGADEPEGLGAIRVFVRGAVRGRDEITALVPDRRFGYRHLSGLPVRDYVGDVELEPTGAGTTIHWRVSFLPKVPGTAAVYRWGVARFIRRTARGLAAHAAMHPSPRP